MGNSLNAVFSFKIDGVDQELPQSPLSSDLAMYKKYSVAPGFRVLEWKYKKINIKDTSDDLKAEIYYIKMVGTQTMNKECQVCTRGVPNAD